MNDHDQINDRLAKDLMSIHSCGFTQDEIIEMARQAGGCDITSRGYTSWVGTQTTEFLERFAKLLADQAAAKERERIKEENQRCYVARGQA